LRPAAAHHRAHRAVHGLRATRPRRGARRRPDRRDVAAVVPAVRAPAPAAAANQRGAGSDGGGDASMSVAAPQAGTVQLHVQVLDVEPFSLDVELPTYLPARDLTQRVARDAGLGAYWEDGTRRRFWLRV